MQLAISLLRPRFVWTVVIALACWAVPGGSAYGQSSLHDAATALTKTLHADADVQKLTGARLVIAPFENINGQGDAVPRILQEMLTTSFIQQKHFKVVERDQLQKALDELHFQLSDLTDTTKAKQIGKLVGAAYIMLGSISDTGASTDINARVVSVESGESVAADDAEIKTGGAVSPPGDANPVPASPADNHPTDTGPGPQPTPLTPKIDLNAHANSESAGQWIGSKDNFGVLGATNYKIAWREKLGTDKIISFAAGDLLGDGTSRLVLVKDNTNSTSVSKWTSNKFIEVWRDSSLYSGDVLVLPVSKQQDVILKNGSGSAMQWDGTSYVPASFNTENVTITDEVLGYPTKLVGYAYFSDVYFVNTSNGDNTHFNRDNPSGATSGVTSADYDGDGQAELAVASKVPLGSTPTPIEVYDKQGHRKAITAKGYGGDVTSWRPKGATKPFIVARLNTADSDNKPNGGYVYFIRWNGESYEEAWKSVKFEGSIIRMLVCDPKGEGTPGLVVLSGDDKGYYLTKIVPANQ